jgi:hypothetical protein
MGFRLVVASSLALLLVGCGGTTDAVRLSIRIDSGFGAQVRHQQFTLRCHPTGGDIPNRVTLCRMIDAHPQAMLFPDEPRSFCIGGLGRAQVTVKGTARGGDVSFARSPMCEWPGGVSALAYVAAADARALGDDACHLLPVASARLRCDEDAALLRQPTPWSRVRACLSAQPRAERPSSG